MKVIYVLAILIVYLEMLFKAIILKSGDVFDVLYTLLFSSQIILILNLICNIFKEKVSKIILITVSSVISVYFCVQAVFFNLFSIPFSFSTLGLAGGAMGYTDVVVEIIVNNALVILAFLLPLIALIIFNKKIKFKRYGKKVVLIFLAVILGVTGLKYGTIHLDRNELYSAYNLYYKLDAQEKNIEKFGVLTATGLDLDRTLFGFEEEVIIQAGNNLGGNKNELEVSYNEVDLKLDKKKEQTNDKTLKSIYEYIETVTPTNKNEYTGYFKDKNLIFILAEGFNSIAVDKELTPTLYKLTNSGFVFNNFYSPVFLSTTGGEFQATTGLIPSQTILNLWKSNRPDIRYALGNSFFKVGYTAKAFHNWTYSYYSRQDTMKTLGFDSYMGIGNGLEKYISSKWLPRDVDMMKVTTDYYTKEDKFVTYYITVSGHAPYNFGGGNSTALRYKDLVKDLPYSTAVKAYLAAQMELDRALETLIERLDKAGVLEDTVLAVVGDHYPYTLSMKDINSISTYERDEIVEVNRSNFIIWNSKMEETIEVEKTGSQIDVLPTLLNLFDIEYDSRLIIGQDILSNNDGIAIFSDRSWVSDLGTYFAADERFVAKQNVSIPEGYVDIINQSVSNKFTMSNLFIKYNIYEKLVK